MQTFPQALQFSLDLKKLILQCPVPPKHDAKSAALTNKWNSLRISTVLQWDKDSCTKALVLEPRWQYISSSVKAILMYSRTLRMCFVLTWYLILCDCKLPLKEKNLTFLCTLRHAFHCLLLALNNTVALEPVISVQGSNRKLTSPSSESVMVGLEVFHWIRVLAQLTTMSHGKLWQHTDRRKMSHPFWQQAAPRSIKAYCATAL